MPGSRLLPAEQRSALPVAPTTSRWWRTHVLVRSWLNRHRHRWLAPLLVCAPPVGVAMLWAGATRPGHQRRWLTAGAGVWMIVLGLMVSLLALPGASTADAGGAPPPRAGGPALPSATSSARPAPDAAASAAAVRRRETAPTGGVAAASVTTAPPAGTGSDDRSPADPATSAPASAPTSGAPAPSTPARATPVPTRPTPTPTQQPPTRSPHQPPGHQPPPPVPTASPFTPCSTEGATAVSTHGIPLRCFRTPIGLYWLWSR